MEIKVRESLNFDEGVLSTVLGIWSRVSTQTDLTPANAVINGGLSLLVREVMRESMNAGAGELSCVQRLKAEGVCEKIRFFCQNCEYQMECFWAKKVIASARSVKAD